ncbi:Hypothetical predicted protein [Olea europaea subsp. europaea]|uniref:Uncharacterized protein n=1 Tax=Olea europaea subsp. europaea TaxID=158383 RepID=A0A8S0V9X9_OLEEU|nr:Hypothetical predicted protein [Olea europaea subsp. europaea]
MGGKRRSDNGIWGNEVEGSEDRNGSLISWPTVFNWESQKQFSNLLVVLSEILKYSQ